MNYREQPVSSPLLKPWVQCMWTAVVAGDRPDARRHRILPDGCVDILLRATTTNVTAEVVGTMTAAVSPAECLQSWFFGIRFRPAAVPELVSEHVSSLTDTSCPLGDFWQRPMDDVIETWVTTKDFARTCLLTEHWLLEQLPHPTPRDPIVRAAAILGDHSTADIQWVADHLGMTRQHLRRRFLQATGVSPKRFQRIMRLQRSVGTLLESRPLVDVALSAGYADQAHMTRDYRDLVGLTPTGYLNDLLQVPNVQDGPSHIR